MQWVIDKATGSTAFIIPTKLLTERHVALFFVYLSVRVFTAESIGTIGMLDEQIGAEIYAGWCLLWSVLHYNCVFANNNPSLSFRSIITVVLGLLPFAVYIGITFEAIAARNGPHITPELYIWLTMFLGQQLGSGACLEDGAGQE